MKKKSGTLLFTRSVILMTGLAFWTSCTSHKKISQKTDAPENASNGWDYARIREARQAEEQSNANVKRSSPGPDKTLNCAVVSESQMQRGKLAGCTPLDERLGYGANQFCCPRE